ncbi:SH3 domain-containing protein [Bacteroidota bacterium]
MKHITTYLLITALVLSCSGEKKDNKQEAAPVVKDAICIWDNASIRETPSKSAKYLGSLVLGEKITVIGEPQADSTDNNREYYEVRLSDGSEGWVSALLVVPEAEAAVITYESRIYKRADLLTETEEYFEPMDFMVIISKNGDWLEVIGEERNKSGWINDRFVSTDEVDVSFAILANKALASEDPKERSENILGLLENIELENAFFRPDFYKFIDPFEVDNVVEVKTADELLNSFASNTKIIINANTINLGDAPPLMSDNVANAGIGLQISGLSNLIITSLNENTANLVTSHEFADVIYFSGCRNIYINNITAGHSPIKGECDGGVLRFVECSDIHINNSVLFGSGVWGLSFNNSHDVLVENTTIKECTYEIVSASESSEIEFRECDFRDNTGDFGFTLYFTNKILVTNSVFNGNRMNSDWAYDENCLFNVGEASKLELENSLVENNNYFYYQMGSGQFEEYDVSKERNEFSMEIFNTMDDAYIDEEMVEEEYDTP